MSKRKVHEIQWISNYSVKDLNKEIDYYEGRTPFHSDLGNILHSNFFKRLSNKTQVYANPHNDFVRTRLTHSLEVSQIAMQLLRIVINRFADKKHHLSTDVTLMLHDLTQTAALAHDIGHSPFGHDGQKALNECARKVGLEFDDNKQSVHMLVDPNFYSELNVTCSLVDAIIKKKENASYSEENNLLENILKKTNLANHRSPISYLIEAADDIAYLCSDFEDYIRTNEIDYKNKKFIEFMDSALCIRLTKGSAYSRGRDTFATLLKKITVDKNCKAIKEIHSHLMKCLISHAIETLEQIVSSSKSIDELPQKMKIHLDDNGIKEEKNILYSSNKKNNGDEIFKFKKKMQNVLFTTEHVSKQKQLIPIIINDIWESLVRGRGPASSSIINLLPSDFRSRIESSEEDDYRVILDFIAGMTDRYAIEFWNKISNPNTLKSVA